MAGIERQGNYSDSSWWLLFPAGPTVLIGDTVQRIFVISPDQGENFGRVRSKTWFLQEFHGGWHWPKCCCRSQEIFPHNIFRHWYSRHSDWCGLQHIQLHCVDSPEKSEGLRRVANILFTEWRRSKEACPLGSVQGQGWWQRIGESLQLSCGKEEK